MKDLIDKTKAIARMAGQTEYAQARLAKRFSRLNFLIAWIIIGMTASVGISHFAPYGYTDPAIAAFVALGAAALGIILRVSGITARTTGHRVAETQYSRVRRDADMLILKMRGGDLSRAETLSTVENLNTTLCDLIARTTPVSNRMLRRAGKKFDKANPEIRHTLPEMEPSDFLRAAAPNTGAGRKQ